MSRKFSRRSIVKSLGVTATGLTGMAALSGSASAFSDGERIAATTNLNTREQPGTDQPIVATVNPGEVGEIMNGPTNKGGYTWWGVHWLDRNVWGWSVERYLQSTSGGSGGSDFDWPISGYITSPYGARPGHYAVDIGANGNIGEPIYAAHSGTVDVRAYEAGGCGNYLKIGHGNGYQTMYCHLNSFDVVEGESVSRGQLIGGMGTTGNSTGPHLHFTVERNGNHLSIPGGDGETVTAGTKIPKDYSGI
ncbi:peptidoglycan DD-metalloendopeptidase family protein [Haladaptatus paucihalophilus]|uniref:Peptidase family M23 n=3 Tax=Haladaptatus paucihalophilus TaxID=367189 RepID=A0A1M6ZSQ9_HALPU|nr:peptidoglycan DD-metalloendopeptidase family protein [Haladaptatus paucihalophilus]SHL33375.1 Peptidase family M23 [Haladaptatus paucihalophilus DX253]